MVSTVRLDAGAHPSARPGTPLVPQDVLDARRPEVEDALLAVDSRSAGIIWTAEPGMGKTSLLDAAVAAIAARSPGPAEASPRVVRISPRRLGPSPRLADLLDAFAAQVRRAAPAASATGSGSAPGRTRRASDVVALTHAAARSATVVVVIDDIDALDPESLEFVLHLTGRHDAAVVLLATAARQSAVDRACEQSRHGVDVRPLAPLTAEGALRVLGHVIAEPVAPAVAARLARGLGGNAACIVQTARLLSPQHLAGTALIPDPLPLVPAVRAAVSSSIADVDDAQRRALLIAAVAVVDRTDLLTTAAGLSIADLTGGPLSHHLDLVAGSFRFIDPRVRSLVHGEASLAARTAAHRALAAAYEDADEPQIATWHTALSTLEGSPAVVPGLLALAHRHLARGDTEWAHAVAREAVAHAGGEERERALETAGLAAVLSGHMHDGAHWLTYASRIGDVSARARTLTVLVLALTHVEGQVPDDLLARARADLEHAEGVAADAACDVARGLAVAACLHIERGAADPAWDLIGQAAQVLGDRAGQCDGIALARTWLTLCSTHDVSQVDTPLSRMGADGEALAAIVRAVALMNADRCDAAAGVLSSAIAELAPVRTNGRWFEGPERAVSPIVNAHLRVVHALVDLRAGNCARARAALRVAMHEVPVGLVLAGLGAALARRLDLICHGSTSGATDALAAASTSATQAPLRRGLLVDRALVAAFDGRHTEAATLLELAAQRERHETALGLAMPGLEPVETWAMAGRQADARRALERLRAGTEGLSPQTRAAALARAALAVAEPDALDGHLASVAEATNALTSPYERARAELAVARALARARRGDQAAAHYLAAQDLFDEAGAQGWLAAIADEVVPRTPADVPLRSPAARPPAPVATSPAAPVPAFVPGAVHARADAAESADGDHPLGEWAAGLTERERDVARLVVGGMSNRAVAQRLFLSVRTVEVHLGRVFRKLGVHSRVELAVVAHRST